jgi:hypothetical protein
MRFRKSGSIRARTVGKIVQSAGGQRLIKFKIKCHFRVFFSQEAGPDGAANTPD